jgi:YVTN family beta-propeller protein/VCBS repeat-containing protein
MRAAAYVGRVGGLAVALGIGVATGGLGAAWAAPVDSDASASTGSAASPDADAQAPSARSRTARASRPARDVGGDHGARGAVPAPSVAAVPVDRQDSGAADGSAAGVARAVSALVPRSAQSVMTRRVDLPAVPTPSTFAAPAVAHSVVGGLVSSVVPAAAAEVPQMVATPPQAAAADAVEAVWSPLLGSSPGAPTQSPMSWMVLAAARRQFGQQRTASAPAAAVATGQVLSPAAAANATSSGYNIYVTSMVSGTVTVINSALRAVTATISVGSVPVGMAVSPTNGLIYVANTGGGNPPGTVSVIDPSTNSVVKTIGVGTYPVALAVSRAGGSIYVTNAYSNSVSVIDSETNVVTKTISTTPGGLTPVGVAVSPDGRFVYTSNGCGCGDVGSVSVINTANGTVSNIPLKVRTANGSLTGPVAVAVSSDGSRVYAVVGGGDIDPIGDSVYVIDAATKTVIQTIKAGSFPVAVAVNPVSGEVYVASGCDAKCSFRSGSVSVINPVSNTVVKSIAIPGTLTGLAVRPDGRDLYVTDSEGNLSVIDNTTKAITGTFSVGGDPRGVMVVAVPNAAPVIGSVTLSAPNATTGAVTGTVKAADANGDTMTYRATLATAAKGAVAITTAGVFTYTPTATARHAAAKAGASTATTTDTVTVTVTDAKGAATNQAVTVTISPKNTAPTGVKATVGTPNATTGVVTGTITATDADKDPLTYSAPASTSKGTVAITPAGAFTYTPTTTARQNAGKSGATATDKADSFAVTVTDGYGGTTTAAVTVAVSPITAPNVAPIIGSVTLSAPNATTGAVVGTVKASDANGDKMTYKATVASAAKGTVAITTAGVFTYTPNATARHAAAKAGATTATKTDTVTVTVTDAKGAATTQAVTVTISPRNTAPTGAKATVGTPNATTGVVTGTVTATDAEKDPLTYSAPANTSKGTVAITPAGAFTYTPTAIARHGAAKSGALAAAKSDTFTVTVTDGFGGSVAVPVTVTISPVNAVPTGTATVAKPDPITGVVRGSLTAADTDKDTLTFTASKPTSGAVVVNADGSFSYTPTAAARTSARSSTTAKTDTFTITIADGYGGTKAVTVTPTIAPSNAAPVAGTATSTTNATTGVVTGAVNATDPDRDALTYTAATTTTTKGSVSVTAAGAFTYTPTATARHGAARAGAAAGDKADTFSVTVTDKYGAATTIPVNVTISPANAKPVAGAPVVGTPNTSTGVVTGTVSATDADRDTLTYSGSTTTNKGAVVVNASTGAFTYTPTSTARLAAAANGATAANLTDAFTVAVADEYGGTTTATINVEISPAAANTVVAVINRLPSTYALAINPAGTRAYVTTFSTVLVIDLATNTKIATIGCPKSCNGNYSVALNPAGTLAYTAGYVSDSVSVIDLVTNRVTATIAVGDGPIEVAVNPDGTRAYVANANSGSVSVLDLAANTVIATIAIGSGPFNDGPWAVAVNPAGSRAYVTHVTGSGNNSDPYSPLVSVIDLATNTVTATIPVPGIGEIAVNPTGTRAYIATGTTVLVMDLATNAVTATIPVGAGPGEGSLLPTTSLTSIAVNPAGDRAYVSSSFSGIVNGISTRSGALSVIDLATNTVTATIPVGDEPFEVAVNPAGTRAYVSDARTDSFSVILL